MYLLDTNVVSELRKAHKADHHVREWAKRTPTHAQYISVITIMEIQLGILAVGRRDISQANVLNAWLTQQVFPAFAERILNIDVPVAMTCASLHVPDPRSHRDALIAATALVHGLTVVTRNIVDFQLMNISLVNPWHERPS